MIKTDLGGFVYATSLASAAFTAGPPADRGWILRKFNVSNLSANDDWQVIVGGREIMRFRMLTLGNQRFFIQSGSDGRIELDFFSYCRNYLNIDASIPVPKGLTATIQSVGGATADINGEFLEVDEGQANALKPNHFMGNDYIVPIDWRLNASQSAAAVVQLDTQTAPPWYPALFSNVPIPPNWKFQVLALFIEGAGVNTFSGAANHQSTTDSLRVFIRQFQAFSRSGSGIPVKGSASAAGSANTVLGQQSGMYPPTIFAELNDDNLLPVPVTLQGGDAMQLLWNLVGDLTGGASYANALVKGIVRVTVPQGLG